MQIKAREGFRPFAPAVLAEDAPTYIELGGPHPYMLYVTRLREEWRRPLPPGYAALPLLVRLYQVRSALPAITHIGYSARVQTVDAAAHPDFHALPTVFREVTGCPILVNTSFNVRGEPMVCTPEQAYLAFLRTGMDVLVIEEYIFERAAQHPTRPIPAAEFAED